MSIIARYIELTDAIKASQAELDEMKSSVVEALRLKGGKITVDGRTVSLVHQDRTSFDVQALKAALPPTVFRLITAPAVDREALKAALTLGKIQREAVDAATSISRIESVRVK